MFLQACLMRSWIPHMHEEKPGTTLSAEAKHYTQRIMKATSMSNDRQGLVHELPRHTALVQVQAAQNTNHW